MKRHFHFFPFGKAFSGINLCLHWSLRIAFIVIPTAGTRRKSRVLIIRGRVAEFYYFTSEKPDGRVKRAHRRRTIIIQYGFIRSRRLYRSNALLENLNYARVRTYTKRTRRVHFSYSHCVTHVYKYWVCRVTSFARLLECRWTPPRVFVVIIFSRDKKRGRK